jgi:hypothetical protein
MTVAKLAPPEAKVLVNVAPMRSALGRPREGPRSCTCGATLTREKGCSGAAPGNTLQVSSPAALGIQGTPGRGASCVWATRMAVDSKQAKSDLLRLGTAGRLKLGR